MGLILYFLVVACTTGYRGFPVATCCTNNKFKPFGFLLVYLFKLIEYTVNFHRKSAAMEPKKQIFIVEDHRLFREGLKAMLSFGSSIHFKKTILRLY